jgi:predicted DCC family thiol-disulfide oxidoreductase YuxK
MNKEGPVIYFDGVCNLCNGAINFFIKKDKKRKFKYSSLQSKYAKSSLDSKFINDLDTVVLKHNGNIYLRSQAILASLVILGLPYSLFGMFLIIPAQFTDLIYNLIAKNRYKLFGSRDSCRIPSAKERELFLD